MVTENHYTETDLGNISPNPKGEYKPGAEYEYLDLVTLGGGSYLCLAPLGNVTTEAPQEGKTTDLWQCIALPGDLTPEYIAMHDDVVNKYQSAAEDREAIDQAREDISGMEENVRQMQAQTADSAAAAEGHKDSAAGYAAAAESSRTAAETAETNTAAQVSGFDTHVAEKTAEAEAEIAEARRAAVNAVTAQQSASVQAVKDQTQDYVTQKQNEAAEAVQGIVDGLDLDVTDIKQQVADEGARQIGLVETAGAGQVKEVETAGAGQVQNVQQAAEEIAADREQIQANKTVIQALQDELAVSAPAIIGSKAGTTLTMGDSAKKPFAGLRVCGRTDQMTTTGAQLINYEKWKDQGVINGTGEYRDNGIVITAGENGDAYTNHSADKTIRIPVLAGGTYTLSWDWSGEPGSVYVFNNGLSVSNYRGNASAKKLTFTIGDDVEFITFRVGATKANTTTVYKNIMLNAGDTPLPWEPYTGGKPSPSPEYPQELVSVGQILTTGAQLLSALPGNTTIKGITLENNGKSFVLNGTAEENADFYFDRNIFENLPLGVYTISKDNPLGELYVNNNNAINNPFTITDDNNFSYAILRIKKGITLNNEEFHIMLNAGATALPWEPYTGGKPAAVDVGSVNVDVMGAQLLNPELFEDRITDGGITFVKQADGGIKLEGTQTGLSTLWYGEYIDILQDGTTYFFTPDASGGNFMFIANGQKGFVRKITVDKSTMTSIRPYSQWVSGANAGKIIYPMINVGATALPYEPYRTPQSLSISTPNGLPGIPVSTGGNYTDDTGQQWICDEVDFGRGVYVQRVAAEVPKTTFFVTTSRDVPGRYLIEEAFTNTYKLGNDACLITHGSFRAWGGAEDGWSMNTTGFYYHPNKATTAEEVKEEILALIRSDSPLTFLGQLATPIETPLTDAELAAYRALHTNYPTTTILTDAAHLEVEYNRDTETYIKNNYVPKTAYDTLEQRVAALESQAVNNI